MKWLVQTVAVSLAVIPFCSSCGDILQSVTLPLVVTVLDGDTGALVSGASVELQWRVGFQGYYWGKPVAKTTDITGVVVFATVDVPALSSDGYSLGESIHKLFVSALVVSCAGYEKAVVRHPAPDRPIVIEIHKAVRDASGAATNTTSFPRSDRKVHDGDQ